MKIQFYKKLSAKNCLRQTRSYYYKQEMMKLFSCCFRAENVDVQTTQRQTRVNTYVGKRNFLKQQHGNGIFYYENGDIYEGKWKRDKRHGYGTHQYKNGNTYEGEWKRDKKHGYGTFKYVNGKMETGYFKNDVYVGPSIENRNSKRKSQSDTKPLLESKRSSVISTRNSSIDGTDGNNRTGRYGSIFENKPRRLIDPRNSTLGLTADQIIQKQREDEMMREKAKEKREIHRKSIDAMRAKYNIPAKRDSVQSLPDKRNSVIS